MIRDKTLKSATLRFAQGKLRRMCTTKNKKLKGASQWKFNQGKKLGNNYFTAIILISTFTNFGNADTCTVSLAGKLLLLSKYFPYISLISEKRFISVIKIVVFTTL